jgi:hypothetical protein
VALGAEAHAGAGQHIKPPRGRGRHQREREGEPEGDAENPALAFLKAKWPLLKRSIYSTKDSERHIARIIRPHRVTK